MAFGPVTLGFALHLREARVIVRKLVQMRERDLARRDLVVVRDVCRGVVTAVLELHREAHPKLLDVESRGVPVDANRLADPTRSVL